MNYKQFQAKLAKHGLSSNHFARLTGMPRERPRKWRRNTNGVPTWVESWFRLFALLPQADQQRLRDPATYAGGD